MKLLSRRGLLGSLLAAPAVITSPGLLMPVKRLVEPTPFVVPAVASILPGGAFDQWIVTVNYHALVNGRSDYAVEWRNGNIEIGIIERAAA